MIKKNTESFIKEVKEIQPTIEVVGKYEGSRSYIDVKCLECGHEWKAMATNLLGGKGCPICAITRRKEKRTKSFESFQEDISKHKLNIKIIGEFKNRKTKVKAKCLTCGYEWDATPDVLLRGGGCPRCAHTGTSFAEQLMLLSLRKLIGEKKVLSRNRSAIGKELDIYIPSMNVAIEYGAWPWHKNKVDKDEEKYKKCKEKGIRLIEIFDAYDGEKKESRDYWTYKENIGYEYNRGLIKEIVIRICNELNIPFTINDNEYNLIEKEARLNSRKLTRESLQKKVSEINPNILILGDYKDALTKLEAKCKVCGHEWKVIPASLLRGLGCPNCANKSRSEKHTKEKQDVLKNVKEIFPNVDIIGEYNNTHSKTVFKCLLCGNTWTSNVHAVISGYGCPYCKNNARLEQKAKEFIKTIKERNPSIQIIGKYVDYQTPLQVKCLICGNVWMTKPAYLMNGYGCNKCAIKRNSERRRKTHEQFVDELYCINPKIEVIGKYVSSKTKIQVKCKKCGYEWQSDPNSLLAGNGCSICGGNKKKTQEEFLNEMQTRFPSIEVLGNYKNAKAPIGFRCKKCNNFWKTCPDTILHSKGCQKCKNKG